MNLYEFLKLHKFKGFSLELIHRIAIQVLQALLLLHRQKIIHCDLKPENIMLRQ
jgi:dual specificity tyrosine-phosphorylation-regulated kinase 2/3/4